MRKLFSNEQEKYIRDNYLIMNYRDIGDQLGFTERQIRGWINHNCPKKNRTINDYYFDDIDTPLKAYLLGYIYADGWVVYDVTTSTYELGMQLQSQDKYILDKINDELGGINEIYHLNPKEKVIKGTHTKSGNMDYLRVYSKHLVEALIKHGIVQNKTKSNTFPVVQQDLFFDFLRGYIDGDGCYYKDKRENTFMHITCSSIQPLLYIQSILLTYDIQTTIYSENESKHRLMCHNIANMKRLVDHLYYEDGLFCLQRKYEKIKHLLGFAA